MLRILLIIVLYIPFRIAVWRNPNNRLLREAERRGYAQFYSYGDYDAKGLSFLVANQNVGESIIRRYSRFEICNDVEDWFQHRGRLTIFCLTDSEADKLRIRTQSVHCDSKIRIRTFNLCAQNEVCN